MMDSGLIELVKWARKGKSEFAQRKKLGQFRQGVKKDEWEDFCDTLELEASNKMLLEMGEKHETN